LISPDRHLCKSRVAWISILNLESGLIDNKFKLQGFEQVPLHKQSSRKMNSEPLVQRAALVAPPAEYFQSLANT